MIGAVQRLGRYWRIWLTIAAAAIAGAITERLPTTAALASADAWLPVFGALLAAAIVAVPSLAMFLLRPSWRRRTWIAMSAAALVAGLVAFIAADRAQRACTVRYAGQLLVAGTTLTPLADRYVAANPDQTREDLLFDARGDVEQIWTRESINSCRTRLASTAFFWPPLLVLCLLAAAQALPATAWPAFAASPARSGAPATAVALPEVRYDVFLSYRHEEPDRTFVRHLLASLEAEGYTVAIDERDFRVNESFLSEMERCIRQSRFTVAIVSPRYLQSGHCEEEAVICKILDMGERRRRLIPIIVEPVITPIWLHGIVGIDATARDPLVDQFERLKAALGARLSPS